MQLKPELENLVNQTKNSLGEVKRVALDQAWKILQLAVAYSVQVIENKFINLSGKDKKTIALDFINSFYDSVFVIVDIPFVPNTIEPIIHRYVKKTLMIMVGSSIDATVTIFKNTGIFNKKEELS
jgi:hypothetical protein